MAESSYTIELSKSSRSGCKGICKQKINKGELRICKLTARDDAFNLTSYYHPACFKLPRAYATGASKMSIEDFVSDVLEDATGGDILPVRQNEIVAALEKAGATSGKKTKGDSSGGGGNEGSAMAKIKAEYQKEKEAMENGKVPDAKKAKTVPSQQLEAYEIYKGMKNDDLKDVLRWNKQVLKGSKDFMVLKCIDGHIHGRLSRCELCGGTLKMTEDGTKVVCGGSFDEDTQQRLPCSFESTPEKAPRWKPWHEIEPSEEEMEEMDKLIEQYKEAGGAPAGKSEGGVGPEAEEKLAKAIAGIPWDLTGIAGIKEAVKELLKVLKDTKPALDFPETPREAKTKIASILQMNRDKSPSEIIPVFIKEFGFAEEKKQKAEKKESAIAAQVECAANAKIVSVLGELADLYFKEGNRNAGMTYKKACAAICKVSFEIDGSNAKGLGKGKTKVEGIGKGTADKIHEFVTTGTMQKLEEKRGDAA